MIQQYDGTINTQGVATSYGIDVDQYDVSAYLSPGQTSATLTYSAGADLVLLMTQIVSATSDPIVDLSVTSTHTGTFVSGGTGQYTITVSNSAASGIEREDNVVTVRDTLPAGLTYSSFSGTGWACGAVGQLVTCTHPPTLNPGASYPPLTLTVNVLQAAAASVVNTAVVSTTSYEIITPNNTATDTTATLDPNVSTSTKSVVDMNGGEASPGDTLRYTITLTETAGGLARNVSLTDDVPDDVTFSAFVSVPAGATSSFTAAPAGANGNGIVNVSAIDVPASSSVTVVFDVIVVAGTLPGTNINNTATLNNPNGAENNPSAPHGRGQSVADSEPGNEVRLPASHVGRREVAVARRAHFRGLQRARGQRCPGFVDHHPGAADGVRAVRQRDSRAAVAVPKRQHLSNSRDVTVTLTSSSGYTTTVTNSVTPPNSTTTPTLFSFTLPNTLVRNFPAGTTFTLTVTNAGSNNITVWPNGNGNPGNNSRIEFPATTVINVDSIATYSAAFNGGVAQGTFYPGTNVFVRAQISDPFGSFDIGSARITITDPANATPVNNQPMTAQGAPATCNSTSAATCIFQYQYALPASPALGAWTVRVTANEGTEGTVTDFGVGSFTVAIPQPALTILKTSTVISDPVNSPNPKRIPLAVVRYDVTVTNSGPGTVDAGTLVITDPIPPDAAMYVGTTAGIPVEFFNGATSSGLTFNYPTHVSYSSVGASGPWLYVPLPDANGFDPLVRAVRISPAGVMSAAGAGNPSFTIQFRVRIN